MQCYWRRMHLKWSGETYWGLQTRYWELIMNLFLYNNFISVHYCVDGMVLYLHTDDYWWMNNFCISNNRGYFNIVAFIQGHYFSFTNFFSNWCNQNKHLCSQLTNCVTNDRTVSQDYEHYSRTLYVMTMNTSVMVY